MHDIHGWKLLEVYFHTQQTELLFDFRARSSDHFTEDYPEVEKTRAVIEDHLVNASLDGLPSFNMETLVHTYLGGLFLV